MVSKTDPKTILIVEDDPNIMKFASKVLQLEGYRILESWDASESMQLLKENTVDLVLLDLMLPGPEGWEVINQMKADVKLSEIPVVVFSAAVELPNQEKAIRLGAAEFLMKPLSPTKLRETIRDILARQ